jgi:NTE family protein
MKRIGLTLGGGGARGICHIAFIQALDEMGIQPSVISGASMGAIIGGFYAAGVSGKEMEDLLESVGLIQMTRMIDLSLISQTGLVRGKKVTEFLSRHIPARCFEDLRIPLKVVAVDFWAHELVVYDSGSLIPAIRASMSIPVIFDPVIIDKRVLIDGGVLNAVPFDIIREDCDILIAIDVSGTRTIPGAPVKPKMFENIMETVQMMQRSILESQMDRCEPDIIIKPALQDIGILEFDKAREILQSVREDAEMLKIKLSALLEEKKRKRSFHGWTFRRDKCGRKGEEAGRYEA